MNDMHDFIELSEAQRADIVGGDWQTTLITTGLTILANAIVNNWSSVTAGIRNGWNAAEANM